MKKAPSGAARRFSNFGFAFARVEAVPDIDRTNNRVAIVLQAGLIAGMVIKEKNAGGFETASAPATFAGEGTYAFIRFQPQASAADLTRVLATNHFSVAGGPTAGGLYRVRIATAKLAKPDIDRIVKTSQQDKVVGFIAATE